MHGVPRLISLLIVSLALAALRPAEAMAQAEPARKAVLVTGATSGLGLRMAEVLSRNGFLVYAGGRKPADLRRLDAMPNVRAVRLDVTIQSDIDAAVAFVTAQGHGLYGLVNNAGVSVLGPLIEIPETELDFLFDVNLLGPYRVTKGFAELLIESRGRVMNVTSIAGVISSPFSGVYSMSKHGLEAYTDSLAAEMDRFGVRVAAIEPGNYRSNIVASMVRRMETGGYSGESARYGAMRDLVTGPLDRSHFEPPDDVALAVLDFMTTEAPKARYLVVPSQAEAGMTLRWALKEVAQLNQDHPYSYTRDELVGMLDAALAEVGQGARTAPAIGLHAAAFAGDVEAIAAAIRQGADPDARDATGATPLIVAVTFDRGAAVSALLEAGADVDRPNADGSTPLHVAALFGREEIVKTLLDRGADRTLRSRAGTTALDIATMPWDEIAPLYDLLRGQLEPLGLVIDDAAIRARRPVIAGLLAAP